MNAQFSAYTNPVSFNQQAGGFSQLFVVNLNDPGMTDVLEDCATVSRFYLIEDQGPQDFDLKVSDEWYNPEDRSVSVAIFPSRMVTFEECWEEVRSGLREWCAVRGLEHDPDQEVKIEVLMKAAKIREELQRTAAAAIDSSKAGRQHANPSRRLN